MQFLLPSLKLKEQWEENKPATAEEAINGYLLEHFGGYTLSSGNIEGRAYNKARKAVPGEHKKYEVTFPPDTTKQASLERFLAHIAHILDEEEIYFIDENGDAWSIGPVKNV